MEKTKGSLEITHTDEDIIDTIIINGKDSELEITFYSDPDSPTTRKIDSKDFWKMLYPIANP